MGKAKKRTSKRVSSKQVAKVDKKVRRFKRDARRTARKMKNKGILGVQRKEKDPALLVPNTWPGKEQILQQAAMEREMALEEKKRKKEAAKKVREWEKANPEKAKVKRARAEARALQLEEAKKEAAKASQHFSTQVKKVVPRCNCVIQVLDARAPYSSISPAIEQEVIDSQKASSSSRPVVMVYVLNKVDLVPRAYVEAAISALSASLKDEPSLKITRKVAAYSTNFTESPGVLMRLLQTDWLKNAFKKKIVAAVLGYPNTGKKSIIRDLEVTSKTVSVHASSHVPGNPTSKIPGATEVALVTFPRDSKVESREADGFNVIFKQNDAIDMDVVGKKVAKHAAENAAVGVSTFYKIAKVKSAENLLESLCKKRGFYKDSAVHLPAACAVLVDDLSTGKLLIAEELPPTTKLTKKDEVLNNLLPVVKQCIVADVKLIKADKASFKMVDYDLSEISGKEKKALKKAAKKVARENGDVPMEVDDEEEEELEEMEEVEESVEDPETYKFNDAEWSDEEGEEEEDEEIEEIEEDEE